MITQRLGKRKCTLQSQFRAAARSYLVCYPAEVLLSVADYISNPEDGAVGVIDHVKVALLDIVVCDGGQEVPPAVHTHSHMVMFTPILLVTPGCLGQCFLTWCS